MSSTFNKTARDLAQALKKMSGQATSPYDTQAEVKRIDGNTAWVHIPGGVDETPVQLTTNAKKGDIVQVRVSGGRAWLYGNATSPPTDDTKANEATKKAEVADEHATNSLTSAMLAQQYAEIARSEASSAATAADEAWGKALEAEGSAAAADLAARTAAADADRAFRKAEEAEGSATNAWNAASSAQWQLGAVEDVVGTLEWIANHAVYRWTDDTTVRAGKWYYTLTAEAISSSDFNNYDLQSGKYYIRDTDYVYTPVADPDVSDISTYYEYDSQTETYSLTQDVAIDTSKTYYTREGHYIYEVTYTSGLSTYYGVSVTINENMGDVDPHAEYYYEIDTYDKTVRDYIYTYLSLDAGGLHLNDGNINNRVDISTANGVEIWNAGKKVAQYGVNSIIGDSTTPDSYYIKITSNRLSFLKVTNVDPARHTEIAYISGEELYIPRVVVVDSLKIGYWMWDGSMDPNHLTLRWMGA